jgi:hypothetical protein
MGAWGLFYTGVKRSGEWSWFFRLVSRSRMVPIPLLSSWRGALFVKHRNKFTVTLVISVICCNGFYQRVAREQLCKHGPMRNSRWGCVFYVVRTEQLWNNGVMQPVCKQQLGKQTSAWAVTSATIETVFSMGSVQSAYKRSECSDRICSGAVTSQS